MSDTWVQIRIRMSTKEKLDNAKEVIEQEFPELKNLNLSYNYIINRIHDRWIKL